MKKFKLIDIAPYSGKRVKPFQGFKRYMSTGDLKDEELSFTEIDFTNKPSRADIEVQKGDVLFAKMTNTNKALLIDKELDGIIVSTGFSVHRPKKNELDGEYLLHYLKHNYFHRQKNKFCTGAIQSAISNKGIEKIMLPVPTFSDQQHIANILSKVENLIAQRKESIRLLDAFLKSTFLEMFGDPNSNSKKWKLLQIKDIGHSRLGKMLDKKKIIGNNLKPYLRNSNVLWFDFKLDDLLEMDFDQKDIKEFSLEQGDILMCEGGEIGRCAIWKNQLKECYFQKAIHRIRLDREKALPEYFVYMFWIYTTNGGLNKYMNAATISHLTGEKLKKMKLPIPPIKLQAQFAQIVKKTEALKAQYQQSLQEFRNLYGSLSQRAFRGELKQDEKEEGLLMAPEPEPQPQHVVQSRLSIPPAKKGFAKLVLAGKIIQECKDGPEFTNIKFQKLQHLAEHLMNADLNLNYYNQAAGPYDNKFMHTLHGKMKQQKWFASKGYKYLPLEKSGEIDKYFSRYFGIHNEQFAKLIRLLGKASENQCEIISTLYAVWNDRIIRKEPINNETIIKDFFNWSERKQKYNSKQLIKAIEWMKENGLEPYGFGQLIKHSKKKNAK